MVVTSVASVSARKTCVAVSEAENIEASVLASPKLMYC